MIVRNMRCSTNTPKLCRYRWESGHAKICSAKTMRRAAAAAGHDILIIVRRARALGSTFYCTFT